MSEEPLKSAPSGEGAAVGGMEFRSSASEKADTGEAVKECAGRALEGAASPPDLAFVFVSPHHARGFPKLGVELRSALKVRSLVGCSGGGVIAGGREIERRPGLALLCAWLPDVRVQPFRLDPTSMPGPDARPQAWREWVGIHDASTKPAFVLLVDPFTVEVEELGLGLDFAYPGSVKIGGLASAASHPGNNALYLDGELHSSGAVGVALDGNVAIDPIVAQGCRPIGDPYHVTKVERNLLYELDGTPVLEAVARLLEGLGQDDQRLARTSLFLGVLNDPLKGPASNDYLIRNLMGLDADRGILSVGAHLRPGQTVQFHLRDRKASHQDLAKRLDRYCQHSRAASPRGALLFSCLGRGEKLYGMPNHDIEAFTTRVAPVPIGGFFCNGEIGPVEGSTYLHGYTSCFGIVRPARP